MSEASLNTALAQWLAPLEKARALFDAGEIAACIAPLSEAIRISAAYHPEYHFLESGLNTELGRFWLEQGDFAKAEKTFTRAVFLHHQNDVALAGLDAAKTKQQTKLPAYTMAAKHLKAWAAVGGGGEVIPASPCIFTARTEAKTPETLEALIALTDEIHKEYHKLAAEPWFLRAKAHRMLGEKELAANDQRRAEDLQPPKRTKAMM